MKKANSPSKINYYILALVGLVYYIIVTIGFYILPKENIVSVFDYLIKFVAPAQFIILPFELILAVLLVWQWEHWITTNQRHLILVCSVSMLSLAAIEQLLSCKTITL